MSTNVDLYIYNLNAWSDFLSSEKKSIFSSFFLLAVFVLVMPSDLMTRVESMLDDGWQIVFLGVCSFSLLCMYG